MAKIVQFNAEGGISPFSTSVTAFGNVLVQNNDTAVHSVVWDAGSPASLLDSPANGQDIAPGCYVDFSLAGLPQGTFTFHDGHNDQNTGQIVVT
jgi:hypothetical protein